MSHALDRDAVLAGLDARAFYSANLPGFVPRGTERNAAVKCPFHNDRAPSLSVQRDAPGLFKCHGCGASGSPIDFLMRRDGLDFPAALAEVARFSTGSGHVPGPVTRPASSAPLTLDNAVTRYAYTDEDGVELYSVARFDPKAFRPFTSDGRGGHVPGLKVPRRVLYNLPEVRATVGDGGTVYIAEGEKDCDALNSLDDTGLYVATTWAGGANAWKPYAAGYVGSLAGAAEVIVIADKDEPGRAVAREIAASLAGKVRSVRIVEARAGKDAADHIAAGYGRRDFVPVAEDVAAATPLAVLPILELGEFITGEDEPVPWLYEGYMARGDGAILGGHAGAGKSILATELALAAATGSAACGIISVASSFRVLYVDEEQALRLVRHRIRRQAYGRGISPAEFAELPLFYSHQPGLDLTIEAHRSSLFRTVEKYRPDLIVIDSLVRVTGRLDTNDAKDMAPFWAESIVPLTRDFGASVLMLHHLRKPSGKEGDDGRQHRVRGSSDLPAAVSEVLVLERASTGEARTLYQTKCRWQPEQPPLGLTFEGGAGDLFLRVVASSANVEADVLILNALGEAGRAGMLRSEILAMLEDAGAGDADRQASRTLGRLKARSRVGSRKEGNAARYWARDFAPPETIGDGQGTDRVRTAI